MQTHQVNVQRWSITSRKPFDNVLAAVEEAIGRPNMVEFTAKVAAATTFEEMQNVINESVSESGLMEFMRLDHGAILAKAGVDSDPKSVRVIMGNPLIMQSMARLVPDAGSYAPVTVLVDERADGVHLSYDRMASLLAPYGNKDALNIARDLDAKVENLLRQAAAWKIRKGLVVKNKREGPASEEITAQPRFHQRAAEIQAYGTVNHLLPLELEETVRLEMTAQLNQLLADTMALRDLYKKSHWQVAGPTFYQLHLLFDKHFDEQVELVDSIAERIQLLGGISIAMAHDVAEMTRIERPPRGREAVPVQLSRLLDAHQVIIGQVRTVARRAGELGDDGTNDLVVSEVLRRNELQAWFLSEHLVDAPLVHAEPVHAK